MPSRERFRDRINSFKNVTDDFKKFVREEKEKDLEKVIEEEKLKPEETKKFIDNSLRDGTLKTIGTDIDKLLPPVSRFGGGNRIEKKLGVIEKLKGFFDKYLGLTIKKMRVVQFNFELPLFLFFFSFNYFIFWTLILILCNFTT